MNPALHTLSDSEFKATFAAPMADVTATAEELVDLWAYADPALRTAFPDASSWEWRVKHIYQSGDGAFQHVLIPAPIDNAYFVVVISVVKREILGHHLLNLGAFYGVGATGLRSSVARALFGIRYGVDALTPNKKGSTSRVRCFMHYRYKPAHDAQLHRWAAR